MTLNTNVMKIHCFTNIRQSRWQQLLVALVLTLCCTPRAAAGNGDGHLGLQAGVLYPRIFNATLSYDVETRYHNAWEFYADYSTQWDDCPVCGHVCTESFWHSRYSFGVGAAYKPAVVRGKNNLGRFRIGGDLGTNTRHFAMGIELGYEHVWSFRSGWQLVLQQKNEITFWGKPLFKNGLLLGVRIPL